MIDNAERERPSSLHHLILELSTVLSTKRSTYRRTPFVMAHLLQTLSIGYPQKAVTDPHTLENMVPGDDYLDVGNALYGRASGHN